MKNVKKYLKTIVCLAAITTLILGCSGKTDSAKSMKQKETSSASVTSESANISKTADSTASSATEEVSTQATLKTTSVNVFIAASLSNAMDEIAKLYNKTQPNVTINFNADSSGTLMTQIEEGAACDIFFSAATAQMDELNTKGLIEADTRTDLLNNKVVLVTAKGTNTKVTGFDNMNLAKNMALADGSVPVGKYTRKILMNEGILTKADDPSTITTQQVSSALGNVEINECSNVSKVLESVKEKSNEIGTVYYSDAYSVKDDVTILATADKSLSGDIIYPVALVKNQEAAQEETKAAQDFLKFLKSNEVKAIYQKYMFEVK